MRRAEAADVATLHEALANDSAQLRAAMQRVRRAVGEPLDVQRRIRERPATWVIGAALLGLWLGARAGA